MRQTTWLLALGAPSVSAWSLVWTNAKDTSFVEHGSSSKSCTPLNNPKGKHFEWDSEDPVSISLYGNTQCAGTAAGWAKHFLDKNASVPILSYKVESTDSSSSASLSSPSSGLSGGAIAGIVIGVLAGVILIGAALYFVGRRKQKSNTGVNMGYVPPYTSPTSPGPGSSAFNTEKPTVPSTLISTNAPICLGELHGETRVVELGDPNRVNELEGHSRPPISR